MSEAVLSEDSERRGSLIVLPALNERESLPGVIDEIRSHARGVDLLVVDDGSTDGTGDVARALGIPTITMPFNVGVGGAVRVGLEYGRRYGYGAVVQCDADGQHPPEAIGLLVKGLDQADIVIGARFAGIGSYDAGGPRLWAMRILAQTFSRIFKTDLTDVTSGFRAFGPRAIDVLSALMPPEYLGDTVEALVIAKEHGLVVRQIPVELRRRRGGAASQGPLKSTAFLLRALLMLVLSLVRLVPRRRPAVAR
jgi:glycosyltransferase involved in cell wall biosynthesis